MYRNKSVKGFISPLIVQSRMNIEENNVNTNQETPPNDSMRKPFRSNAQLLSIFEKASPENEVTRDNIEVENNVSKKQDINSSVYEKNTSINDLQQAESKM